MQLLAPANKVVRHTCGDNVGSMYAPEVLALWGLLWKPTPGTL